MAKTEFAQAIISQLSGAIGTDGSSFNTGTASAAMTAVAAGITQYLIANTTVTVKYTGMIPGTPPTPDPVQSDTFKIVGSCAPTGPSNSFDDWMAQIQSNIIAGFSLAPSGTAGVVFPTVPFLSPGVVTSQANLKAAHDVEDEDPQQSIWELVCDGILQWLNSPAAMNAVPGAATHPTVSGTGTANITAISVS